MLAQEAGKFILLLYKGWVQYIGSSELLSVTSSIAWHHDTENQYHLSNNPHPIHKITRHTKLFFISHAVESLRVPRDVQQRAAETRVICRANTSLPSGASLFGNNSDSTAAGRGNSALRRGCSLTHLGLCHILVISPAWQVEFLCTDSSQAAVIKGKWDSPRDKPAKAYTNEAAQTMRCLYLRKAGRLLPKENRGSFELLWAVLVLKWAACFLYHSPCTSVVKLRMLGESPAMQTANTCIDENVL